MRRTLTVLVSALGAAGALRAQQVTARVGGELTAMSGAQVIVPITVDMTNAGGALLGSYTARLTWNSSVLYLNTYRCCGQQDTTLQGNFPPPAINTDSAFFGILKFSAVSPFGVGGLVTVAQLPFYATGSATPTELGLSFSEMSAAGTFQNLLPVLTTQGATFCLARGRWGDLDADGQSNSRDALFVLTHVVGLPVDPQLADTTVADVDADGRTTSRDALVILSHAVGIPVPGHRVLLPVPGACGTGSAQQVAILPGAIDLAVSQQFKLVIQATDSAGRAVSVPAAAWRSSDYGVAAVESDGTVSGRGTGAATITAEVGPGVSATATVTVVARRPNWYVDMAATGRMVQNGSAAYPYERPLLAFPWVAEGDTVRVAPGTYYWDDDGELNAGVVILGGTPGDTTTRPEFRGVQGYYYTGLWLRRGQRTVVRNVVFRNFDDAIDLDGVRNFVIEDSKIIFSGQYYGTGIYHCGAAMDTVRIDRTAFIGDSLYRYGTAVYYSGCANPSARVTIFRDSRARFLDDGLYLYGADSLAVIRSQLSDLYGSGIYSSQEYSETPSLYVTHSRVERARYSAIQAYYQRRVVIDTSVIVSDSGYALDLEGDYYGQQARIYLHGDSIYQAASYYDWLYVYYAESLLVQDVVVRAPENRATAVTGDVYSDLAVVRRSKFLNLGDSFSGAFYFGGRLLLADSVTMTGCAVANCDRAMGFEFGGGSASSSILRSSFSQIGWPVQGYYGGGHEVRAVTIDSAIAGVTLYSPDSVLVTDNVIRRIHNPSAYSAAGVYLQYYSGLRGRSLVARNAISCSAGAPAAGVKLYNYDAVMDQDTVTGCQVAVDLTWAGAGTRVRRSALRGNATGVYLYQYPDTFLVRVDTTAISGSSFAAVRVDYGRVSLFNSRIENNADGVANYGLAGLVSQLHGSAFVNNTGWAVYSQYDSVDASGNYWGSDAPPPTTQPNGVSGRVNTSGHLASPPADLPGLAPPALLAAAGASSVAAPAPFRAAPRRAGAAASVPVAPRTLAEVLDRLRFAPAVQPGRAAERASQIESQRQRRREQATERTRLDDERVEARALRRAERASGRPEQ